MSIRINGKKYINGTVVRANPVEEATGTLEKIGIGSDVYEIQGGGGGFVYDVNDYYLQNGQISDGGNRRFLTAYYDKPLVSGKNYLINFKNSVDGSVVGTSLFKYTSDFTTTMAGGGSIGTITMIITSTSITSNNYTGSWQNIYVDVYREISSAEFYHPVIYSTEEREIGVWTDNKPLYQKTFILNQQVTDKTWTGNILGTNGSGISIVDVEGYFGITDGGSTNNRYADFDYYRSSSEYFTYNITNNNGHNDDISVRPNMSVSTVFISDVTIYYTKDSDVAGSGSYNTLGVPTVHYTTDEQVIGTWIDGKPLYRKTVIKSGTISQRETVSLGIANVENIFLVSDASNVNNGQTPLPLVTGTDNSNNTGGFFDIQQSDTSFLFRIGSGMAGYVENAIITVQYTKTTDQ